MIIDQDSLINITPIKSLYSSKNINKYKNKIYIGEKVRIYTAFDGNSIEGECIEINPLGLSFIVSNKNQISKNLFDNNELSFKIKFINGDIKFFQGKIHSISESKIREFECYIIDILFLFCNNNKEDIFLFKEPFIPFGVAFDNLLCKKQIHFSVVGFKRNGARIKPMYSDEILILPDLEFDLKIILINYGEVKIKSRITDVNILDDGEIIIDVEFEKSSYHTLSAISEYILMFSKNLSINRLKNSGFFVYSPKNALSLCYCNKNTPEWMEVLKLRFEAYSKAGLVSDKTILDMEDVYDNYSRHIVCKSASLIVGSIRATFVDRKKERSEHITTYNVDLPEWLFNHDFIEVGRACTHPNFRGGDVLQLLFKKILEISIESGCYYILISCTSEMWPFYKKIGFKKLGIQFPSFGRKDNELIFFNSIDVLLGFGGNKAYWHLFFFKASKHLLKNLSDRNIRIPLYKKIYGYIHYFFHLFFSKAILNTHKKNSYLSFKKSLNSVVNTKKA